MLDWIELHPFTLVFVLSSTVLILLIKEGLRSARHQKHLKEIENRKKLKNLYH